MVYMYIEDTLLDPKSDHKFEFWIFTSWILLPVKGTKK